MAPTLLPDLTRSNVEWLRKKVEGRRAPLPPGEAHELAIACDFVAGLFETWLEEVRKTLRQGAEVRALAITVDAAAAGAQYGLEVFTALGEAAASGTRPGDVPRDFAAATDRVRKAHSELCRIRDWLRAPRPPMTSAAVQPAPNSEEEYEDLEPIMARLRVGGDL